MVDPEGVFQIGELVVFVIGEFRALLREQSRLARQRIAGVGPPLAAHQERRRAFNRKTDVHFVVRRKPRCFSPGRKPRSFQLKKKETRFSIPVRGRDPETLCIQPFDTDGPRECRLGRHPQCLSPCHGKVVQLPSDGLRGQPLALASLVRKLPSQPIRWHGDFASPRLQSWVPDLVKVLSLCLTTPYLTVPYPTMPRSMPDLAVPCPSMPYRAWPGLEPCLT